MQNEDVVRNLRRRKRTALASVVSGAVILTGGIGFVVHRSDVDQKRKLINDLQISESSQLQRLNHLGYVFGVPYSAPDREISIEELRGFIPLKEVLGNPEVHRNYVSLFDELNSLRKTPSIIDEVARNEYTRKEIQDRLNKRDATNVYVSIASCLSGIPLLVGGAMSYIIQREKLKKK